MTDVKVWTRDDGLIYIEQEIPQDDNTIVGIYPEQIDLLIQWLQEARESIKNGKTN
jgi:hypothetical protein